MNQYCLHFNIKIYQSIRLNINITEIDSQSNKVCTSYWYYFRNAAYF